MVKTFSATTDSAVETLRQLSPRELLRVIVQVLPELERDLPAAPPSPDFWRGVDMHMLVRLQGVRPVDDFDALLGGWPEDESIDDFIAAVREWRRQDLAGAE
jgi:hypothetical protein